MRRRNEPHAKDGLDSFHRFNNLLSSEESAKISCGELRYKRNNKEQCQPPKLPRKYESGYINKEIYQPDE
jgi:hypothetical protein